MTCPTDIHDILLPEKTRSVDLLPIRYLSVKHQMAFVAKFGDVVAIATRRVPLAL